MDVKLLEKLLEEVQAGRLTVAQGLERLRHLPLEDLALPGWITTGLYARASQR